MNKRYIQDHRLNGLHGVRLTVALLLTALMMATNATAGVVVKGNVYGGGNLADVGGSVEVNIKGGQIGGTQIDAEHGNVYGGGTLANTNTDNWNGSVLTNDPYYAVTITTTTDLTGYYTRTGSSAPYTYTAATGSASSGTYYKKRDTKVNLTGGTVKGDVYGGGLGRKDDPDSKPDVEAKVYGDVLVELNKDVADDSKGCIVKQSIFGCNNVNGTPMGKVEVHIYATQNDAATHIVNLEDDTDDNTKPKVKGRYDVIAVYGGGNKAAYHPVSDTEATKVTIEGCDKTSIEYVYGGGNAAPVPATDVTINSVFEINYLFGGGNGAGAGNPGADVGVIDQTTYAADEGNPKTQGIYGTGLAKIKLIGGTIHYVYGGSNTLGNVRGGTSLERKEENPDCSLVVDEIYGAGQVAPMDGDVTIILECMPEEYVDVVYGGAKNAVINGNVTLTVTSGKFGRVFGGNNEGGSINGTITVNVYEDGCKPLIIGEVYGAGNNAPYSIYGCTPPAANSPEGTPWTPNTEAPEGEDPNVSVDADAVRVNVFSCTSIGKVYGGGKGSTATMIGNTHVWINMLNGIIDGTPKTKEDNPDDYIGKIGQVFGGGSAADVKGNTTIDIGTANVHPNNENKDLIGVNIINGDNYLSPSSNTSISITDAGVYGGGEAADVDGNTTLNIGTADLTEGTYITGNIYGGGYGSGTHVTGDVTVNIGGQDAITGDYVGYANITGDVYGGSAKGKVNSYLNNNVETASTYTDPSDNTKTLYRATNVNLYGGAITGDVYGGGLGDASSAANVYGPVTVNVYGGTANNVFGCNNVNGTPKSTVDVNINGGTVSQSVYGGGNQAIMDGSPVVNVTGGTIGTENQGGAIYGNVYGGGLGSDGTGNQTDLNKVKAGLVKGDTEINVSGGTILHNIYGGGAYGSVGTYTYDDNTGVIANYTSGGKAKIYITGGTIGTSGKENGMVFGSSRGDVGAPDAIHDKLAWVYDTEVKIGTQDDETVGPAIKGSVYGGGENGHNYHNADVYIYSGTIGINNDKTVTYYDNPDDEDEVTYTGKDYNYSYRGNVYGAGCGTDKYWIDADNDNTVDDGEEYFNPLAGIVLGDANITMTSGTVVHNVYGAGAMGSVGTMTTDNNGKVTITSGGTTTITISGGTVGVDGTNNGNVFGAARGDVNTTQTGVALVKTTDVTISGTTTTTVVWGSVYGGGEIGDVQGNAAVAVEGGSIKKNVFGGGKGDGTLYTCAKAMVGINDEGKDVSDPGADAYKDKGTKVTISNGTIGTLNNDGTLVENTGNVYGGGEIGRVEWNTQVEIGIGTGDGPFAPIIEGSVFGAGAGLETHGYSALVRGNSTVTVGGGAKIGKNVYGGGEKATVGRYWVKNINNIVNGVVIEAAKPVPDDLPDGMPYKQQSGGICHVTIQDNAEIGYNGAGDEAGHVFGAGQGVNPHFDDDPKPQKKISTSIDLVDFEAAGNKTAEEMYLEFLETLALSSYTHVTIDGSAKVKGNVYGGSESGFVQDDTDVKIQGGTIGTAGSTTYGNVYGGGKGLASFADAGRVSGDANVDINGGTIRGSVYGGGEMGVVKQDVTVNVTGGTVVNDVYGGGALANTNTANWTTPDAGVEYVSVGNLTTTSYNTKSVAPGASVEGLYIKENGEYKAATGTAASGTTYYEKTPGTSVAGYYLQSGTTSPYTYTLITESEEAAAGTTYYKKKVKGTWATGMNPGTVTGEGASTVTTYNTVYKTAINLTGGIVGNVYGGGLGRMAITAHPAINFTQEECNLYNSTLIGAVSTEDINPTTEAKYTEEEANAYNATLEGALTTSDIKIPAVTAEEEVSAVEANVYGDVTVTVNDPEILKQRLDNVNTDDDVEALALTGGEGVAFMHETEEGRLPASNIPHTLDATGRIFGCNNINGTPTGNVTVHVYSTRQLKNGRIVAGHIPTEDNSESYEIQGVYGGGNLADYLPADGKETKVLIDGCGITSIKKVYGGGNSASVPSTDVKITGSYAIGYAFGGGNGGDLVKKNNIWQNNDGAIVIGTASIECHGGKVGSVFGASDAKGVCGGTNIDTKASEKTDPNYCALKITRIYGAGNEADVNGNVNTILSGCTSNQVEYVHGGSYNAHVTGDVTLTITSGILQNVYGGNDARGSIGGKITINIEESETCEKPIIIQNLVGGGNNAPYPGTKRDGTEITTPGKITVNVKSATRIDNVYGGCYNAQANADTEVNINMVQGNMAGSEGVSIPKRYFDSTNKPAIPNITYVGVDTHSDDNLLCNINEEIGTIGNVYGGGNRGIVTGNTTVNIGTATSVDIMKRNNAGKILDENGNAIEFTSGQNMGDVKISYTPETVLGAHITGNVYGGGELANVMGNTYVNVCVVKGNAINDDQGNPTAYNYTPVNLQTTAGDDYEGVTILGNVYGGGEGKADNFTCDKAMIGTANDGGAGGKGRTFVCIGNGTIGTLENGTTLKAGTGNVYGGGMVGRVEANTNVTIGIGDGTTTTTSAPIIRGSVFGAGQGVATHGYSGLVRGTSTVTIQGKSEVTGSVYGGGQKSTVGAFWVKNVNDKTFDHKDDDKYKDVPTGMPYALKSGGKTTVTVQGYAKIGPDNMQMPTFSGNVFGAGKGLTPYVDTDTEAGDGEGHGPGRYYIDSDDDQYKWESYADNETSYLHYIQTLAIADETDVTIKGYAFVKGSVYGGSENGRVLDNTHVKIQENCQIGNGWNESANSGAGAGVNRLYTDTEWAYDVTTIATQFLYECNHWPYGQNIGTTQSPVIIYAPYDPNALETSGNEEKYANGESTEGGRKTGSDGHTFYGNVFGGGSGYFPYRDSNGQSQWHRQAGAVGGNTLVEITGGHILTNVYGGNEMTNVGNKENMFTAEKGKCTVKFGGTATLGVPRTLDQIKAHPVTCYLFGAGKGDQRVFFNKDTNVKEVEVEVTGGIIYGSVFGGGEDGHVLGNVKMTIGKESDHTGPKIGTWGTSYVDGNVFGGGRGFGGDAYTAGNVGGSIDLDIHGGTMLGSIYGGGRLGSVGYGLYDATTNNQPTPGYGEMRDDGKNDAGDSEDYFSSTSSLGTVRGRGHVDINITGGTIGNDHEFKYLPTGSDLTNIPYTDMTLDTDRGYYMLNHTKGGNVFAGGMGRRLKLDNTTPITDIDWTKLGNAKSTKLTISGADTWIMGNVYGGGEFGAVTGSHTSTADSRTVGTEIIVTGGTIGTEITEGAPQKATIEAANTVKYTFGSVYGGGMGTEDHSGTDSHEHGGEVTSSTSVNISGSGTMVRASVFGGGEMANVGDDTHPSNTYVTVSGGEIGRNEVRPENDANEGYVMFGGATMGNVYGGGKGHVDHAQAGLVKGNTNVTIQAGTDGQPFIYHNVYGGGALGSVGTYSTSTGTGDQAYIPEGIPFGWTNGTGTANVTITGGTIGISGRDNGMVNGSSRGDIEKPNPRDRYDKLAWVNNSIVTIGTSDDTTDGPIIKGSVYGGGENGHNAGDATVTMYSGTIGIADSSDPWYTFTKTEVAEKATITRGNVYGAGCGTDMYDSNDDGEDDMNNSWAGLVAGNTYVTVSGGEVTNNVYGGGSMGAVGTMTNDLTAAASQHRSESEDGKILYGFGLSWPLEITYGSNTGTANVTIDGTAVIDGYVYGAAKGKVDFGESDITKQRYVEARFANVRNTKVVIGTENESATTPTIRHSVYGGGEDGHVYEDASVTIHHGTIEHSVFGGGKGTSTYSGKLLYITKPTGVTDDDYDANIHSWTAGKVYGNTTITMNGGNVGYFVYGGGNLASVGKGNYAGGHDDYAPKGYGELPSAEGNLWTTAYTEQNPTKDLPWHFLNSGIATVNIFGGEVGSSNGAMVDNTLKSYDDDGVPYGSVFGGSRGKAAATCILSPRYKYVPDFFLGYVNQAIINIGDQTKENDDSYTGPTIYGSVYGGGQDGHVRNSTEIHIFKGNIAGQAPSTDTSARSGHVFGAGSGIGTYDTGTKDEHNNTIMACNNASGSVTCTTLVEVYGENSDNEETATTKIKGNIYGGGAMASVGPPNTGAINGQGFDEFEDLTNYTRTGDFSSCTTHGSKSYTQVNIKGGRIGGSVFAASRGPSDDFRAQSFEGKGIAYDPYSYATVLWPNVQVSDGVIIGSVYGGGETGYVKCGVDVNILGGTITKDVYGGGALAHVNTSNLKQDKDDSNKWKWTDSDKKTAKYTTTVNLLGGIISGDVYGGGLGQLAQEAQGTEEQTGYVPAKTAVAAKVFGDVKVNLNGLDEDDYVEDIHKPLTTPLTTGEDPRLVFVNGQNANDGRRINTTATGAKVNRIFGSNNLNGSPQGHVKVHVFATQHPAKSKIAEKYALFDKLSDYTISDYSGLTSLATDKNGLNLDITKEPYSTYITTLNSANSTEKQKSAALENLRDAIATVKYDVRAVYGGGNLATYTPMGPEALGVVANSIDDLDDVTETDYKDSEENTEVIIDGCQLSSIKTVYGGGNAAPVPATHVIVNGAYEIEQLFGGGNGKDTYETGGKYYQNPGANVGYENFTHWSGGAGTSASPYIPVLNTDATTKESRVRYKYGRGEAKSEIFGGRIHAAYGGSNEKGNISTTVMSKYETESDCEVIVDETYGGSKNSEVDGQIIIDLGCVDYMDELFGGSKNANVNSDIVLNVTNGTYGKVFGGNYTSGAIAGSITVNVEEKGCSPIIIGELYAGGYLAPYSIYGYVSDGQGGYQTETDDNGISQAKLLTKEMFEENIPLYTNYLENSLTTLGYNKNDRPSDEEVAERLKGKENESNYDDLVAAAAQYTAIREFLANYPKKDPRINIISATHIGTVFGGGYKAKVIGSPYVNVNMQEGLLAAKYIDENTFITDHTDSRLGYDVVWKGESLGEAVSVDDGNGGTTTKHNGILPIGKIGSVYGGGNLADIVGNTYVEIGTGRWVSSWDAEGYPIYETNGSDGHKYTYHVETYTQAECNTYNAANVTGYIASGTQLSATQVALVNAALSLSGDVAYQENQQLSAEHANAYNATLNGARKTTDVKSPAVTYTEAECTENNKDLPIISLSTELTAEQATKLNELFSLTEDNEKYNVGSNPKNQTHVDVYNGTIEGYITTADIKTPAVWAWYDDSGTLLANQTQPNPARHAAKITGNVYGGGKGSSENSFTCDKAMLGENDEGLDPTKRNGGTNVTIEDGTIGTLLDNGTLKPKTGNVYGGGEIARVEKNTVVTIGNESKIGSPVIEGNVFGAGQGVATHGYSGLVRGNSTVTVQGKAWVKGSVYGSGEKASLGRFFVATTPALASLHDVELGMPYDLKSGGTSTVIVRGDAEIGPNNMVMTASGGPDDHGHVFGAGKGVMPYIDTDTESGNGVGQGPGRYYTPDGVYTWESYGADDEATEKAYLKYTETLGITNKSEVIITGNAFVKGDVFGGSENGRVQTDTYVTIAGTCQIGAGYDTSTEKSLAKYAENQFINPTGSTDEITTSNALKECAHWPFGQTIEGDQAKTIYATYDKFADTTSGNEEYYPKENGQTTAKSTDGGRRIASDGSTFYGNVFGGGSGYYPYKPGKWHSGAGYVGGDTHVTISGGHILTNVYGGSEMSNVNGTCNITMTGGTIGVPRTLTQIDALPLTGYLFGAGKGDPRKFFNSTQPVGDVDTNGYKPGSYGNVNVGNTNVEVSGGIIYGSVLGGAEDGHVLGNTTVTIKDITDTTDPENPVVTSSPVIGTWGTSYVDGNIFGGGRGFSGTNLEAGNVVGNTTVNIEGGTILGTIYGGGRLASVGTDFSMKETAQNGFFQNDTYTAEDAKVHNARLKDALNSIDALTEAQATAYNTAMSASKATGAVLTATEANNYNATLPGAVKKDDVNMTGYTTINISDGVIGNDREFIAPRLGSVGNNIPTSLSEKAIEDWSDSDWETWTEHNNIPKTKFDKETRLAKVTKGGKVFGGSMGRLTYLNGDFNPDWPKVGQVKETHINITGGLIKRDVLGGGELGIVKQDTYVTIGGTREGDNITKTANCTATVNFDVYGGGYGSEDNDPDHQAVIEVDVPAVGETPASKMYFVYTPMMFAGCVGGNTHVDICGGWVKKNVFGGGEIASVGIIDYSAKKNDDNTYTYINNEKHADIDNPGTANEKVYGFGLSWPYEVNYTNLIEGGGETFINVTGGRLGITGKDFMGPFDENGNPWDVKTGAILDPNAEGLTDAQKAEIKKKIKDARQDNGDIYGGSQGKAGDRYDMAFCANVKDTHVTVNYPTTNTVAPSTYKMTKEDEPKEITCFTAPGKCTECISGAVYGGGDNGHVLGNTDVTLTNGLIGHAIYGGGSGKGKYPAKLYKIGSTTETYDVNIYSLTAGKVYGNTNVTMTGGLVVRNVYGGGNMGSIGKGNYAGGADDYYPAGYGETLYKNDSEKENLWTPSKNFDPNAAISSENSPETMADHFLSSGKATVTITGGTIGYIDFNKPEDYIKDGLPYGNVFGGCRGEAAPNIRESPRHLYSPEFFSGYVNETNVTIGDATNTTEGYTGPRIYGSVYGGGQDGHVRRDTHVKINNGRIGIPYLPDRIEKLGNLTDQTTGKDNIHWLYCGNVYGAGSGISKYNYTYHYADDRGDVTTEDYSTSAGSVTRFTYVDINGGTIYRNVYGGGSQASVGPPAIPPTRTETAYKYGDTTRDEAFGGGTIGPGWWSQCNVNIRGTVGMPGKDYNEIYGGEVYGASRGDAALGEGYANVVWTLVKVMNGAHIMNNVFGGGDNGIVKRDTDVRIGEPETTTSSGSGGSGARTDASGNSGDSSDLGDSSGN